MRPKPLPRPARRVRPLLALRRRPRLWWVLAGALATGVGAAVSSAVSDAEAARAAWGEPVVVIVAARDLRPGHELSEADVSLVERPAALVPPGALRALPVGASTHTAVFEGEILLEGRLAPAGLQALAAVLPPGTRAVAVPVEAGGAPPLLVGDVVDVLVALPREAAGDGPPGFVLATGALVVDVADTAVTVAVEREVAPRLAVALGQGAVMLALVGA